MSTMLKMEEAQARALALAPQMQVEQVAAKAAFGRYLAEDLVAQRTQPPADLSAMDGYAVGGDGPWKLVGESRAGAPFQDELKPGEAARISTGAHMAAGSDRVLIQENAEVIGTEIRCFQDMPASGRHVRRKGFDFATGNVVLAAGMQITPAAMALAISAGHAQLPVRRVPRIAVLDSGDELSADPTQCRDDQIPASNGAMIAAMLAGMGCEVTRTGAVADDMSALAEALNLADDVDILVTSGGASVGDHDLLRPALQAWGAELDFWKVAMKPGKPVMIARRGTQVVLGLPGNPVSSYVTAFLFLLPMVRRAMGAAAPLPMRVTLPAGCDLPEIGRRREFLRGIWDGAGVTLAGSQDSSALVALAQANCLIDRPAGSVRIEAGTYVPAYLLQNGGIA